MRKKGLTKGWGLSKEGRTELSHHCTAERRKPAAKRETPTIEEESFTRECETKKEMARWWWLGGERDDEVVMV